MNRRWIFAGLFVLTLGAIVAAGAIWGDGDWGPPDRDTEVVRIVDDQGNTVAAGSTIIVERDRGGFFPFGIFFIPLAFLLFFGLARLFFGGGPRGGPWGPGGDHRAQWLDEWHKRQHQEMANPAPPAATDHP
jgi:hypothetical protein